MWMEWYDDGRDGNTTPDETELEFSNFRDKAALRLYLDWTMTRWNLLFCPQFKIISWILF